MTRFLLTFAAIAAAAVPVHAESGTGPMAISVPLWSVRLDHPDVVTALRSRIGRVAELVCRPVSRDLKARLEAQSCRERAEAKAKADLDRMIRRRPPATAMVVAK